MPTNQPINLTDLDFLDLKENLKTYLRSQSVFSDYDFEGSGLSVLLDILTYHSTLNAFYLNQVASEAFLDTAVLRDSVVSRAKAIGYTPRSVTSAKAFVDLIITPDDDPVSVVVPKGTRFVTKVDNRNYTFSTLESVGATAVGDGTFTVTDLEIVEGDRLTHRFTANLTTNPSNRYVIPNPDVETTAISVKVQTSSSDSTLEVYNKADDINELTSTSKVYFIQENLSGKYEIYFGDGIVGYKPVDGNIIIIEYLISHGAAVNKAKTFELVDSPEGYPTSISNIVPAAGGLAAETIESIKYLAPLAYEAQNRAVTKKDYETLIRQDYPGIDSVRVWGGEENDPQMFGRVFISLKPETGLIISETAKDFIVENIIRPRNPISIEVVIVDPTYIYLVISTTIKYKSSLTSNSVVDIQGLVTDAILNYGDETLDKFDSYFRYSKFTRAVDSADPSIQNNLTTLKLKAKIYPTLVVTEQHTITFNNELESSLTSDGIPTLESSAFTYNNTTAHLQDDGLGKVQIYRISDSGRVIIQSNTGTIDYETGKIVLNAFVITGLPNGQDYIDIIVRPKTFDVYTSRNQLIVIEESDLTINVIDEDV